MQLQIWGVFTATRGAHAFYCRSEWNKSCFLTNMFICSWVHWQWVVGEADESVDLVPLNLDHEIHCLVAARPCSRSLTTFILIWLFPVGARGTYGNTDILKLEGHLQCGDSPCPGFCHLRQAGWQVNPRGPPASASALGLQVLTTVASLLDSLVGLQPFSHIALKMSALEPVQPMKVLAAELYEFEFRPQNLHSGKRALIWPPYV